MQLRSYVFPTYYPGKSEHLLLSGIQTHLLEMLAVVMQDEEQQQAVAERFMQSLPEIKRLLHTDIEAVLHNDPAVADEGEVVMCYPLTTVMLHYRAAHQLQKMGVKRLPRLMTERAHSLTGVDIHPAAQIGESFCIDHGTGIVIGATAILGNHVVLYQGVTLGAKNFTYDSEGHPIDVPRHPILEDHVTVYSNTSILGRVRIGHDTIIGGNIWLTDDVPAHSKIVQSCPQQL